MKIYNSKFKKLVVSGCSFTYNNHKNTHCIWSNALAEWAGMHITNLAVPGAGNAHIKNSIILHLEQTQPAVDDTLVLVMWSGPERIDWITDEQLSRFKDQYPFTHNYAAGNELVVGGGWWANKPKTNLDQVLINYSKYQSDSSLALQSWLYIQDLENYLKIKGYNYYFLSWFDYSESVDMRNRWIKFDYELNQMNLTLDKTNWIASTADRSLGEWAVNHPEYLAEDQFHMRWQGHEVWLKEVLIPELIKKNVLNENTA